MTSLKTRFAAEGDAEEIAALVNAAFKVERFFIDGDRISSGKAREMMRRGKFMLAEDGSAMIACVYVEIREQRGYFGLLAVDPSRQGGGIRTEDGHRSRRLRTSCWLRIYGSEDRQHTRGASAILSAAWLRGNGHRTIRAGREADSALPFVKMSKRLGVARAAESS